MAQRKLSKGAQAARANNYGTLANFRRISREKGSAYARGAALYAKKHGLKNPKAAFAPTSKYARLFGKAMFNKDGTPRQRPNRTYLKQIEKGLGAYFQGPDELNY